MMTAYGLLWAAGGNDILAIIFNLSINQITYFMRVAVFVVPVMAFFITRRWCISLQRHDNERLLHGYETGIIMRSAEGGYSERHLPISEERAYTLTARDRDHVLPEPYPNDAYGVREKNYPLRRLKARLSQGMFGHNVQKPTEPSWRRATTTPSTSTSCRPASTTPPTATSSTATTPSTRSHSAATDVEWRVGDRRAAGL